MTSSIKTFWEENGYYHARNIFSQSELKPLESDFDRIVERLQASDEKINADRHPATEFDKA